MTRIKGVCFLATSWQSEAMEQRVNAWLVSDLLRVLAKALGINIFFRRSFVFAQDWLQVLFPDMSNGNCYRCIQKFLMIATQ